MQFESDISLMTRIDILEAYKEFCKERGLQYKIFVPKTYEAEQTLGDIFSNLRANSWRDGKEAGLEEAERYKND